MIHSGAMRAVLLGRSSSLSPIVSSSLSSSSRFASSSLYDHRRVANRKGWKGPEDQDPDFWVLPDERLGNSYDLNWALTNMSIAPKGDAFLNLFPRGLQYLSKSPLNGEKATVVGQEEKELPVFSQDGSLGEGVSAEQYRQSLRELRMYFSSLPNIFVNDGAVGSANDLGANVRVVSDNADTSLFLKHNLIQVPAQDPYGFEHSLTVYVAEGLGESPSATIDLEKGEVQLRGATTFEQLQDVLANLFLAKGESNNFDLVKCDARIENNGDVSLVLDAAQKGNGYGSKSEELYASKHVIVEDNGVLSRLWSGVNTSSSLVGAGRGDLVSGGVKMVGLKGKGNQVGGVKKVFVLVNEGKSGKVSKKDAVKLLEKEKILLAGGGEKFEPLLEGDVYAVNVSALSEEEVNAVFKNPESIPQAKTTKAKKSKK